MVHFTLMWMESWNINKKFLKLLLRLYSEIIWNGSVPIIKIGIYRGTAMQGRQSCADPRYRGDGGVK